MCGHFAINYIQLIQMLQRYGIVETPELTDIELYGENGYFPSRGDVHSLVPVVLMENSSKHLDFFRWDLIPSWWNKSLLEKKFATFNARDDSLAEKASYRTPWKKGQRCIIPATDFFEWPDKKSIKPGVRRREHRVSIEGQEIISLAGLWESWSPNGSSIRSCTIITTQANDAISQIPHNRMPVILPQEHEEVWLNPETTLEKAKEMLKQYPSEKMKIDKI